MQGSPLTISAIAILVALCSGLHPRNANSQQQQPEQPERQTVEPVFRVPKIAPESNEDESAAVLNPAAQQAPQSATQQQQPGPVARVADARALDAPANHPAPEKKAASVMPPTQKLSEINSASHPLDRAIEMARSGLAEMQKQIYDYTAILVKRERVGDVLGEPEYMKIKIRNPRIVDGRNVPLSIYMKFVKPRGVAGREVIWVDGQNENNLVVHEPTALVRFRNFHLDPNGFLAMKGNKYPIYDAGLENLVLKLIEKAERDKLAGVCEVNYKEGAMINRRPCMLIEVKHSQRQAPYDFHLAKVYIDDELNLPVRFVAYDWPTQGQRPQVMEEYTYINVKPNVGLTDVDFSITNPAYNFAK